MQSKIFVGFLVVGIIIALTYSAYLYSNKQPLNIPSILTPSAPGAAPGAASGAAPGAAAASTTSSPASSPAQPRVVMLHTRVANIGILPTRMYDNDRYAFFRGLGIDEVGGMGIDGIFDVEQLISIMKQKPNITAANTYGDIHYVFSPQNIKPRDYGALAGGLLIKNW